jgi:hypothetical protein
MDVLSAERNGLKKCSELMKISKLEHHSPLAVNGFDGLQPLKVSRNSQLPAQLSESALELQMYLAHALFSFLGGFAIFRAVRNWVEESQEDKLAPAPTESITT